MFWTAGSRCSVLLAVLIAPAVVPRAQQRPAADKPRERGALAVLRRDGVIFPFAVFTRDDWRIAWPTDLRARQVPPRLAQIPDEWWGTHERPRWHARLLSGEERDLALEDRPWVFEQFCEKRVGIHTNYHAAEPLPPVAVDPFPKDGLAISGDAAFEPIERLDPASAEARAMIDALRPEIDKVESRTIDNVRAQSHWVHPVSPKDRQRVPVKLESWYRSPSGDEGWTVSYIEAARQYPPRPEDKGCGLETLVSGFLHYQNGLLKDATQLRAKVTYCDRVGATYMLPFGRVRPREKTYWVFQLSGYEDEWYEVAEIGPKKVRYVIEVHAGSDRACKPR
jgi:hypothetical protein